MLALVLQEVCDLQARTLVDSELFYSSCLSTFAYSEAVRNSTLSTLLALNEVFVFKNAAKQENAYGVHPVDIEASLQELQCQSFDCDFDFHSNVTALYERLRDAHTKYRAPAGYYLLKQFLPVYPFYDSVQKAFVLRQIPTQPYQALSDYFFAENRELQAHIGKVIKEMNAEPIESALIGMADLIVSKAKEQNARFNELLRQAFFLRPIGRYLFEHNGSYTFTFEDGTSATFNMQMYSDEKVSRAKITELNQQKKENSARAAADDTDSYRIEKTTVYKSDKIAFYGAYMLLSQYYDKEELTGFLLEIRTFSPSDITEFVSDFETICEIMDAAEGNDLRLVISVLQNGGGYITLGFRTLAVLAPYIQPRFGQYSILPSELNHFFVTSKDKSNTFSTQTRYNYSTNEIFENDAWFSKQTDSEFDVQSGTYSFDLAYDEVPASEYERLSAVKTPHWLDTPENTRIAFVTDGLCGSTCACFITRAKQARAGLFLGIGGIPDERRAGTAIASFPGGSVMRSDFTDLFDLRQFGVEKFPLSSYAGWAHEYLYSWTSGELKVLEYLPVPVDDSLDIWPEADAKWLASEVIDQIYEQALEKLRKSTYDFWVTTDGCYKSGHEFYGKNSTSTECYLFACDKGYQLENGKCNAVPKVHHAEGSGMSIGMQIFICVAIVVVGVVICGIVWFVVRKNNLEYKKLAIRE